MRIRNFSSSTFVGVLSLAAASIAVSAQSKTPPPLSSSKLVGVWTFNKELSSPSSDTQSATPAQRPSGGGSRGGRSGGGGFGGRGGGGRGGAGGGGSYGGGDPAQMAAAREFMRELMTAPETVTIVADDSTVTFTDDHGVVRKYTSNGKKEKIEAGSTKIDATTKWDGLTLTQDLAVGPTKANERYTLSDDGNQLTEVITVNNRQTRHVFTRAS